jgi:large subunit ribosomal protein L22
MEATAKHNFCRIAPRKVRLVMDLVRGRPVDDALSMLQFSKKRAAIYVSKVIKSAVANYQEKNTTPGTNVLVVKEARVDGGPILKRFQPKDRGKAHPIQKRTSHLVVAVDEQQA